MRIVYIGAGAAGAYCGACARDVTLVRGLLARGHDAMLLPLYTPLTSDMPDVSLGQVFYGGINVYLQDRFALFRRTPRLVDWLLDRPALLRVASRFGIETRPEDLGDMTVSVLRGADGRQRKELERLMGFLEGGARPDVVHLTNSLLSALAAEIRGRLGAPVLCTLMGEESFVARLPEPYRGQATDLMRKHAEAVDLFVAPAQASADEMSEFLAVPQERIRVVRTGVDTALFAPAVERTRDTFRIGFLSRLSRGKGIDLLCEAFRIVARRCGGRAVLSVAGQMLGPNKRLWKGLMKGLAADGLADRVEQIGAPDLAGKVAFLRSLSVFCVPVREPEPRLVACIEAMAAGVPAVGTAGGVFPELIELTGGGLIVPAGDAAALAAAICELHDDAQRADEMGRNAAEGVAAHFSADRMVDQTLSAYEGCISARRPDGPGSR